ncbi:MAG: transposase [Anaerolineae bacterium]|nr:transposase [Anaerolineae bacterium]
MQLCRTISLDLSQPQSRHLRNIADALLVCEDEKTLAALQWQFVEAPDASNMADFLRISPWEARAVHAALRQYQIAWMLAVAERAGAPKVLYINIDDSLGEKDPATRHLEPVSWFHDHRESTKNRPRYKNAFCYVVCTLRCGDYAATLDLQLYLRAQTVRKLNRQRPRAQRLSFRSKYRIARQMLADLAPLLPPGWQVYVQFDSWYASTRLLKYVRRQGWHATCALKSNRKLNGTPLKTHAQVLKHKWYTQVRVTTADGDTETYFVRSLEGQLAEVPFAFRVFFSKRHPRATALMYFACTDLACSAKQALQGHTWRWSCETVNFYLKNRVGLSDFRVQSFAVVDRYIVVVHLAWAYIEQRFAHERSPQLRTYGDILRQHRDEHAVAWLHTALQMAVAINDPDAVLRHFLRRETLPAL